MQILISRACYWDKKHSIQDSSDNLLGPWPSRSTADLLLHHCVIKSKSSQTNLRGTHLFFDSSSVHERLYFPFPTLSCSSFSKKRKKNYSVFAHLIHSVKPCSNGTASNGISPITDYNSLFPLLVFVCF